MKPYCVALVAWSLALAAPAHAAPVETVSDLVADCDMDPEWCRATLTGDLFLAQADHEACIPPGQTIGDVVGALVQWLKMREDLASMPWFDVTAVAYKDLWPCGDEPAPQGER